MGQTTYFKQKDLSRVPMFASLNGNNYVFRNIAIWWSLLFLSVSNKILLNKSFFDEKYSQICYSNFKSFRNKWARIFYVSVFKFTFFVLQRDSDNDTALHNAVLSGNFDIVKLLVKNLIKINVYNHNGYTPLQLAMEKGHSKVGSKEFYPPVS